MSVKEKEDNASSNGATNWKTWLRGELRWNKKLIVLKFVLFFFQGGMMAFLPFLTLHMLQLGLTIKEIAIVYAFLPIPSLLGPPISGIFANRFGKYKIVLIINITMSAVVHCMLLYVPSRHRNPTTFACGDDEPRLTWDSCDYCHDERNGSSLNLVLQNCKFLCDAPPAEPSICYHTGSNSSTCHTLSMDKQINVNGTISSLREADTCSHQWFDLLHEGEVYQRLSCLSECRIECQVIGMPHCHHPDDPSNSPSTFWLYFGLRMIATFFLASAFTTLDATVLAVIKDHNGDFGKQKILTMIGQAVAPLVAGFLIDYHSRSIGYSDYMPALYLGGALNLVAAALVFRLDFTVDKAGKKIFSDLKKLITKPEIDMFLLMILILGSSWGFIESYLFLYLKQLKAPNYLMGLTVTVGCIVGVPVMYICDKIVDKLGRHMVFIISFITYAIRHFGYANIKDPWLVFPFEILEVLTFQIMWVAAVTYCPILAPKGLLATMTGLAGAVHYSVGRGVGSLLGGYLISKYGLIMGFNFFGYVCLGCGILYILVYIFFLKNRTDAKEKQRKEEELQENAEDRQPMIQDETQMGIIVPSKTENGQLSKDI